MITMMLTIIEGQEHFIFFALLTKISQRTGIIRVIAHTLLTHKQIEKVLVAELVTDTTHLVFRM